MGFQNELEQAERRIIPGLKDRAINDAIGKVTEALKANLCATIANRAYDFGRALLTKVVEQVNATRERVVAWKHAVQRVRSNSIASCRSARTTYRRRTWSGDFNGEILLDEVRLQTITQVGPLERASQFGVGAHHKGNP